MNSELLNVFTDELHNEQRKLIDYLLADLFQYQDDKILNQLDEFIESALKRGLAFKSLPSSVIHCTAALLGPRDAESLARIDKINQHIMRRHSIKVYRLPSYITKMTDLKLFLDEVQDLDKFFIIIEYTEQFIKHELEENLVMSLHKFLDDGSEKRRIMIMFCLLSTESNSEEIYYKVDTTMLRIHPDIVQIPIKHNVKSIINILVRMKGMCFELSPQIIHRLSQNFMEIDPSGYELKFLYDFCLIDFYSKPECILHLSEDKLLKALKKMPQLKAALQNLESVKGQRGIPWKDSKKLASFCKQTISNLRENHNYLIKQMKYYGYLICDPADQEWPHNIVDIYLELVAHNNLGQSTPMANAILRIRTLPQDVIISRIETALKSKNGSRLASKKPKVSNDVGDIFEEYLERLRNNDNCKKVVEALMKDLHEHVSLLENPFDQPFNEALYYKNEKKLMVRSTSCYRSNFEVKPLYDDDYWHVLYNIIKKEPEKIDLNGLYDQFKHHLGVMDEDSFKCIFCDQLDVMAHQGIIKISPINIKKGFVKRLIWY